MESGRAWVAGVLVAAAIGVVAVMTFPSVSHGRAVPAVEPEGDDEVEPEITIAPTAPSLKSMRSKGLPDGGIPTVDPHMRYAASLTWGSGKNQLGRSRPREGNPTAPMSLAADAFGNPWVLDQVNRRVVKLDDKGRPAGDIALSLKEPRDLAVSKSGAAVVASESTAVVLDTDGKMIGAYELGGKMGGLVLDGDDIWVAREGGMVRIGDLKASTDTPRTEVQGRLSRDGRSLVTADLLDGARGKIIVSAVDRSSTQRKFARELSLGMPVMSILLLDTDSSGLIYLAALGERVPGGGSGEAQATVDLLCIDPTDGKPLGRSELPANTSADQTFREMTALEGGGVLYLFRTEAHAEVRRVDCR